MPVFAVPATGSPAVAGGNRMIPQATAVWMVPQPAGAAGAGNQPTQFWAIQSAPQLVNFAGAQFPTAINVADFQQQQQQQPVSTTIVQNSNSGEHMHFSGADSHEQQRRGRKEGNSGGVVDHPEEDEDDDDDEPVSDSSPEE